jgi:hypothetical protein
MCLQHALLPIFEHGVVEFCFTVGAKGGAFFILGALDHYGASFTRGSTFDHEGALAAHVVNSVVTLHHVTGVRGHVVGLAVAFDHEAALATHVIKLSTSGAAFDHDGGALGGGIILIKILRRLHRIHNCITSYFRLSPHHIILKLHLCIHPIVSSLF